MRKEVRNCWRQAEEDLITARANIDVTRYYASVFFSQQAADWDGAGCGKKRNRD